MSGTAERPNQGEVGRERFRRVDRMRKRREFERASREGRRRSSHRFVVLAARRPQEGCVDARGRLGVTVSRKVGNAVVRNRVKRGIREWYRRRGPASSGWDTVVIARRAVVELSGREMAVELERLVGALEAERCAQR